MSFRHLCAVLIGITALSATAKKIPLPPDPNGDVLVWIDDDVATYKAGSNGTGQMSVPVKCAYITSNPKAKATASVAFYLSSDSYFDPAVDALLTTKGVKVSPLKISTLKMKFNFSAEAKGKHLLAVITSPQDGGGILQYDNLAVEWIPDTAW